MTHNYLILLIFALFFSCSTNKSEQKEQEPEQSLELEPKIQKKEILVDQKQENTFPFNEADRIELVSYTKAKRSRGLPGTSCDGLIDATGKFSVKEIEERITLNKKQKEELFKLLFIVEGGESLSPDGYMPRNAIIFYQKKRVISYIELCFLCRSNCYHPQNINFTGLGEHDNLVKFFQKAGIKKGLK